MPLPDERKGGSVASILAKFQANVDAGEGPLIPKARFGQAPPKQQQQPNNDNKPPSTYIPPSKPISLPPHTSTPPTTSTAPAPEPSPPSARTPSGTPSLEAHHKPLLAPVITKPTIDLVPDTVPGSADKLLGVQVEGLGRPSSPQAETGRLSAPGSPLCSSPPPVSVPFPSTEEPDSPTRDPRRLSAVSAASISSALSSQSAATPSRKHSTAAAPTAASLAKTRPRVESTTRQSPTRLRSSPVLVASPSLSGSPASTSSPRMNPTGTRSPAVSTATMARARSGSTGSVSSSVNAVRKPGAPSNGTPRSRAAAAAKVTGTEGTPKPRSSVSPQSSRGSASAKSTPAGKSIINKPRTSDTSTASASPPATRTSPLASRSAPSSKPGTPSSGRATPSNKGKTTVAKPFLFGRPRRSDASESSTPETALAGLGISQSDSEASAKSSDAQFDAGARAADEDKSQPLEVPDARDESDTPVPTTPTLSATQVSPEDDQPTPRAQRFDEAEAGSHAPAGPAPGGKVFGGGAGGRPFGRIPIPMEDDGEGGLRPKAAEELSELQPASAQGEGEGA